MKKVLFATSNVAKIKRFQGKLSDENINIISLADLNIDLDPEETGSNASENALIKARAYYTEVKMTTIAMDDTLYLDNVPDELQPGVNVRRVNGKRLTDEEMIEYYSSLANKYGVNNRLTARWVYAIAIIKDGKEKVYTWSKEDFYISSCSSDVIQEGYPLNSISINKKLDKYFTDMTVEDWNLVKEDESEVIKFLSENI